MAKTPQLNLLPKEDRDTRMPPAPPPGKGFKVYGLTLALDPDSLQYLRKLTAIDLDLRQTFMGKSTIETVYTGRVSFIRPDKRNNGIVTTFLTEGSEIMVHSRMPVGAVRTEGVTFEVLDVEIRNDPMTGPTLIITDPRRPCQIIGTPEFSTNSRAAYFASSGAIAPPEACMTCTCPNKPAPG